MVTMIQTAKAEIAKLQFCYLKNHVNNLKIFEEISILPKNLQMYFLREQFICVKLRLLNTINMTD